VRIENQKIYAFVIKGKVKFHCRELTEHDIALADVTGESEVLLSYIAG